MSLAYIILAHKNPEQLHRLVSRLHHPDDYFFIHIDKKVDNEPFLEIFKGSEFNFRFIEKRENSRWGDIGLVKATINGLKELIESKIDFSHVSLLSGQDYPIKPLSEIREFFARNPGKSFIEYTSFPVPNLEYGGLHRIESYSFNIGYRRDTFIPMKWKNTFNFKGKVLNLFLGFVCFFLPKRKFPNGWKPYYGSQWWSLSNNAVQFIITTILKYPNYLQFQKYSLIPDEMFFQTILLNNYKGMIVNDNKRFIVWDKGASHPVSLKDEHYQLIKTSAKLFARKFDSDSNLEKFLYNDIK